MKDREKPANLCKGIQHSDIKKEEASAGRNAACEDDLVSTINYCFHYFHVWVVPAMRLLCLEAGMRQDSVHLDF